MKILCGMIDELWIWTSFNTDNDTQVVGVKGENIE